jgi:hypothetical protein
MCIFSGAVDAVSSTKILVSRVFQTEIVEQKERGKVRKFKKPVGNPMQLVVYSNKVILDPSSTDDVTGMRNGAAMILPFPLIKGRNRMAVLDMSRYKNFFDDVELLFPMQAQSRSLSNASYDSLENSMIDVLDVGSYKASVVPKFDHFHRLQFAEFNLHPDVTKLLERYYKNNYGFVVCILKPQATYHPFAYVHELRSNGELFIPTRHYHGEQQNTPYASTMSHSAFSRFHDRVASDNTPLTESMSSVDNADDRVIVMDDLHLKNNFFDTLMDDDDYMSQQMRRLNVNGGARARAPTGPANAGNASGTESLDWDHEIYIVNRPNLIHNSISRKPGVSVTNASPGRLSQAANYINFKKMPLEISFGNIQSMAKITIDKLYTENHDLFV